MRKAIIVLVVLILVACGTPSTAPTTVVQPPALIPVKPTELGTQPTATPLPEPLQFPSNTPQPVPGETPFAGIPVPAQKAIIRLSMGQKIEIVSIQMMDSQRGWAIDETNHVLCTTDGGNTWQDVTPPEGAFLPGGFFALNANTAWATFFTGLYPSIPSAFVWYTTDGGQSWQASQPFPINRDSEGTDVPVDYYRPQKMYFLDSQTGWLLVDVYYGMNSTRLLLFRTEDGGKTWAVINDHYHDLQAAIGVGVAFIDKETGWYGQNAIPYKWGMFQVDKIVAEGGWQVSKTLDGGHSFNESTLLPLPAELHKPEFAGKTADCGETRMLTIAPHVIGIEWTCWIYTDPQQNYKFYALTSDGGQSWHSWLASGNEFFLDAQTGWRLSTSANSSPTLQKTINGGLTWAPVKIVTWQEAQFEFVDDQVGWAIVKNGEVSALVRTVDGGKTWTEIKPIVAAASSPESLSNTYFTQLQMHDKTNGWAFAYSVDGANYSDHYYRTTDGGKTWIDRAPKGLTAFCQSVSVDAQTAWLIECGEQPDSRALLGTTDGGDTWTTINEIPPYFRAASVLRFISKDEGWTETYNIGAGSALIQVAATHDSGRTWAPVIIEGPHAEIWNSTHLCNICEDSFYYDPLRVVLGYGDMSSMNPAGEVNLSMTNDLGKTWNNLSLALPSEAYKNYLVTPRRPTFFNQDDGLLPVRFLNIIDGGIYTYSLAFYATSDGGKSWRATSAVLDNLKQGDIKTALVSPLDIFVGNGNDLYFTHNGAQSWQTSTINSKPGATQYYVTQLDFVSARVGWAILKKEDDTTSLWSTSDGGQNWAELKPAFVP